MRLHPGNLEGGQSGTRRLRSQPWKLRPAGILPRRDLASTTCPLNLSPYARYCVICSRHNNKHPGSGDGDLGSGDGDLGSGAGDLGSGLVASEERQDWQSQTWNAVAQHSDFMFCLYAH